MTDHALSLPSVRTQAEHLIDLGVAELAGVDADRLRTLAASHPDEPDGPADALLAIDSSLAPASMLTPLLRRDGRPGFIVSDMSDVDQFTPIDGATPPSPVYVVSNVERGDELANWSPDEALAEFAERSRSPLTLTEGIHLALQAPAALERGRCYMTIGSRLRKPNGRLDSRTPALWISNGTGRDGRTNKDAPKVGWCWAGNRHTWLGFASATARSALPA